MRRGLLSAGATLAAAALASYLAFRLSPWPAALLIRHAFTKEGERSARALLPHVPRGGVAVRDVSYDQADPDARLDVFSPAGAGPLPTIVWVHGGGWVAGTKDHIAGYLQVLAAAGFTVVGVDYSLAPGHTYPTPVRQVNRALAFLVAHADRFRIDTLRVFLAGDSGGAQIAAQVALILRDPAYAAAVGVRPGIAGDLLRGTLLYCGPYDLGLVQFDGPFAGFLRTVLWSYSGRRDFLADTAFVRGISIARHVTPRFPPSFVTVGNADPLAPHSQALAAALGAVDVPVDTLFFAPGHVPPLPHEYQFDLDTPEGQEALRRSLAFLKARAS